MDSRSFESLRTAIAGLRPAVLPVLPALAVVLAALALRADRGLNPFWLPVAAVLIWFCRRHTRSRIPALDRSVVGLGALLAALTILQLVPLPSVGRISYSLPFSVIHVARLAAYLIIFWLVRRQAVGVSRRRWRLVYPLLGIAAAEAVLGIAQSVLSSQENFAVGTYRQHSAYASLLAMALPFAVGLLYRSLRRAVNDREFGWKAVVSACGLATLSTALLGGVLLSASRSAFIAALVALAILGLLIIGSMQAMVNRASAAVLLVCTLVLGFALISTERLVHRFSQLSSMESISADAPVHVWRQAWTVFLAHPVLGCGIGAYGAAAAVLDPQPPFLPANDIHAHSDYLELIAELGIVGALIIAALAVSVFRLAIRQIRDAVHPDAQLLAMAAMSAIAAFLVNASVESNLTVPLNTCALFWIAAIASAPAARTAAEPLDEVRGISPAASDPYRSAYV